MVNVKIRLRRGGRAHFSAANGLPRCNPTGQTRGPNPLRPIDFIQTGDPVDCTLCQDATVGVVVSNHSDLNEDMRTAVLQGFGRIATMQALCRRGLFIWTPNGYVRTRRGHALYLQLLPK
jgi:hypothetical protein